MTFFQTAAAAQAAGFRPCLRCRPETSPDLAAWHGSSATVTRALALIDQGAMDGNGATDVESLATRLGMGGRQLRRLFRQHLGASPIAVAQTRRVLLAKQLIQETALPMADVALAAGFGSVRRFNETFQRLYARPPAALRRRGTADRSGEKITLRLAWRGPYDWESLIAFLGRRAIPGVEAVSDGRYARTIGRNGYLTVEPCGGRFLRAAILVADLRQMPRVVSRVRRIFDLAADPEGIGRNLAEDPALAPLVAARPGLRVPGAWDGFELAARAILGQQVSVAAATMLAGKFAEAWGTPAGLPGEAPEGLTLVFPEAATIAALEPEAISLQLGMPRARGRALHALAKAAADPLLFSPARGLEEAITRLTAIDGIGEWTAHYIAMRELREPDAFPAADAGLLRAWEAADGSRPTPSALLARAERWRPWRAYAAMHLWQAGKANGEITKHGDLV